MGSLNPFGAESHLTAGNTRFTYYRLRQLSDDGIANVDALPYSIRVLLEGCLRNVDGVIVHENDVKRLAGWSADTVPAEEVPVMPGRVILQDFTGVPAVVDLAALRSAMIRMGGDPKKINPVVPCDLVIDHSIQVDHFGKANADQLNVNREFERNGERYRFLRWGQQAFDNFRVVPPATGIVHQVNLEYLARSVLTRDGVVFPDSLVGTDSHTTMINGLGVVGWGVGGIEAEAVMLGQPIYMLMPQVVGFRLSGELSPGTTATDLVLTITQMLRQHGVVGKFVEFCGPGLASMRLADRATLANMSPEYGATMGFFPVDNETLDYLRQTGRPADLVDLVERYYKEQGLFRTADSAEPSYSSLVELDLSTVVPSLAGPKRPQDRIALASMQTQWKADLDRVFGKQQPAEPVTIGSDDRGSRITDGAVVIAAITSCTNTSNPSVMMAAGLLAKKAVDKGLTVKPWVKTSLAPGSRVVTDYLTKAGFVPALETLGFHNVGYGCTTCIGNSGPLPEAVSAAITTGDLVAASVLSGNRNFEGRVNPFAKANYLASPPLVVAYALAGTVDIDLTTEPIGQDADGNDVFLKDIWPSTEEVRQILSDVMSPEAFIAAYAAAIEGPDEWRAIATDASEIYEWDADSTYVQEPPFFVDMPETPAPIESIQSARVLVSLGNSTTTDHISPAGAIPKDSPAANYLRSHSVSDVDFNSFGSRRGNDRVMTRGTFGNIRLRNFLAPGTEGGVTKYLPADEQMSIFDAAQRYKQDGTPLIVLAGSEYGTGSSRDWAAKGTSLLGIHAVIAESYERIHRSNLVGMGILPLEFRSGESRESLGLDGTETFDIALSDALQPGQAVEVTATKADGEQVHFVTTCRIDTPIEIDYYRHGGILHYVLRQLARS